MGVIKVETFDVDVTSNGQTHTLTNTLPSTTAGFVRNTNPRGHSGGPIGNTGTAGPDDMSGYSYVSSTTQLTLGRQLGTTKMVGEVWRYTGAPGGADEFIVRDQLAVTLTTAGPSTGNAVAGVSGANRNRCVCFITGKTCTQTSQNNTAEIGAIAYLDSSGNLTVERGSGTSTLVVYVTVVEFTGTNWSVGYAKFPFSNGDRTVYTDSQGDTGSTATLDWDRSFIIEARQGGGNGSNDAIEDMSFCASPGSATTVTILKDSTAGNTGDGFVYILQHPSFVIGRATASRNIPNNNTYFTETFPGSASISALDEASLEWTVFSDGTGTAHGRGALCARITGTTTIQSWVHRSGNNGTYQYGVIDLSGLTGVAALVISDVDTDNVVSNSQQNVVVTGSEFEALQGTGKVELVENSDYSGTIISQTIDSWSDTSIQFDVNSGALADTNCFLFVTTDSGSVGSIGITVGTPPLTYQEIITDIITNTPTHYLPFHSDYVALLGGQNAATREGSPTFQTAIKLTRGAVGCLEFDGTTDAANQSDNDDINLQAKTVRQLMIWIRLTQVQDAPSIIYEEGGGVNNWCFFIGAGNTLVAQLADTSDDNVHCFSDFALEPNRTYCILMNFDYSQANPADRLQRLYIDGVEQTASFGNPLTATDLDGHSGDISHGHSESTLEVFGTDVNFPCAITLYYSDWVSWTSITPESEIRELLFEQGAIPDLTISSDTEANMQTALNALADTTRPNSPLAIAIEASTDGNFELEFDNIQFDPGCSIEIQYLGTDTLTAVNLNGTSIDSTKISTPNSGVVTIVEAVPITVNVADINTGSAIQGARVYITAGATGPLTEGAVIFSGLTDVSGQVSPSIQYSADQSINIVIRKGSSAPLYKGTSFTGTVTSSGFINNTFLIPDE